MVHINRKKEEHRYERASEIPYISKGYMTLKVPFTLFRENRERLVQELRKMKPNAIVIIQAANYARRLPRKTYEQYSKFFWSFGYQNSGAIGVIDVLTDKSYLILPKISSDGSERCEKRAARREIKKKFLVNGVWYLDELEYFLDLMKNYTHYTELLILGYQKLELPVFIFNYEVDSSTLCQVMHGLMALKTEKEITILRYIAKHLEAALTHILHRFRPGMTDKQLETWFTFFMKYKSDFEQLTFYIFSGDDPSSYRRRHFFSKRERVFKEGDLCVIDVGAAYFGYKMSLGIVLPASEKFDCFQEKAYEAMLGMRSVICQKLKAGLPVDHLRTIAEKFLLHFLISSELVRGTVEGAVKHGVGRLLMPQCLVRSMDDGCEDVEELELGKTYLVQPGCYFTKRWMDEAYKDDIFKLYLRPELRMYENIGVQVSDPIIITNDGYKFLSNIPRSCCTINDMRLLDDSKIRDFTIELENENLVVSPSSFSI